MSTKKVTMQLANYWETLPPTKFGKHMLPCPHLCSLRLEVSHSNTDSYFACSKLDLVYRERPTFTLAACDVTDTDWTQWTARSRPRNWDGLVSGGAEGGNVPVSKRASPPPTPTPPESRLSGQQQCITAGPIHSRTWHNQPLSRLPVRIVQPAVILSASMTDRADRTACRDMD